MTQVALARQQCVQGWQFKPADLPVQGSVATAHQVGSGYEPWLVRCGGCKGQFVAIIHTGVIFTACAHCSLLLGMPRDRRDVIRARRAAGAPVR